jgi:hypothetical protein
MNAKRIFTFVLIINLALSLAPGVYSTQAAPPREAAKVEALAGDRDDSQTVNLPEGVSADWWAQAQAYIQQSEYEISWQEPTYLADISAA